ncbi:MAG: DUF962 domain-containing protein [Rubrivivax sp.]|nr:DUF962 domain-containing protein [Rubrivivax sp.]
MPAQSLSRPALDLLAQYARHHRDRRNIATHLVGIPMVLFAAATLLSRGVVQLGGEKVSFAWLALAAFSLWALSRGQLALGAATVLFTAALVWAAHGLAGLGLAPWLAAGVGLFVAGWALQFVGHYYEGRRPASADDAVGLLVGPMFVVLELLVMAGFCRGLMARIEQAAGPTMLRDLAQPLPR